MAETMTKEAIERCLLALDESRGFHLTTAQTKELLRLAIVGLEANRDAERLAALHTSLVDSDGYEWGVARVKWKSGKPESVLWGLSDHSDLDAAIEDER